MRIIRFEKIDERQDWGWSHIIDHIIKILYRSYEHDIIQVPWPWYYKDSCFKQS